MRLYFYFTLCLILLSCTRQTEDSFVVDLDTVYDQPNRGFLVLYSMDELEERIREGITFPDMTGVSDTAFAKTYFTGNNFSAIENNILLLIGDYQSEEPLIWVDNKNDLNFSDVDEPLIFSDIYIDISISDIDRTTLEHTVRLHKVDDVQRPQYNQMIEQYITRGRPYVDFYFEQSRNIRVGDFVFEQDSLRIGIVDWDVNGAFNDLDADRIVIGELGGLIKGTDEASGAVVLDSTTYFHGIAYAYKVLEVSPDGKSIEIKPAMSDSVEYRITEGQSIPDYSFTLISGEETSISENLDDQRFLYLNFWATWCAGCHQEIGDLKEIHSEYSELVSLISLNYNEDIERINSFLDRYDVDWLNGHSTDIINEELFIYGLPRNILIDPSGTIVEMNIHPSNLLNRIDEF